MLHLREGGGHRPHCPDQRTAQCHSKGSVDGVPCFPAREAPPLFQQRAPPLTVG